MMKKHYISVIILVILIALYFLVEHRESLLVSPRSIENFLSVDSSDVDKIVISKLGGSMTLSRAGSEWYVMDDGEARKADGNAVGQLMDVVVGMKVANVISDNPARQITFQVDTLTGSTVSLYSGDNLLSAVVVGKMADFAHTYVRLKENNDVYLAEGMMSHLFNRSPSDWRDKTIFDINPEQVQSVEFKFADEHYRVARTDTAWEVSAAPFTETSEADRDSTEALVRSICALNANSFAMPYDTTRYDFSTISYSAVITMKDGSTRLLEAASATEETNRHFLRVPEDTSVFIVLNPTWSRIARNHDDLLLSKKNS